MIFRKIKPNPFLIIEKATSTFQNLHELISETYLSNEEHFVPCKVEKGIRWIPPINGRFKLNFDGSRINNTSALGWVIRDFNGTINIARSRHLSNVLIIIAEFVALRNGVLVAIYNGFTNLEIKEIPK